MWKLLWMILCVINMTAIQGSLTYKDCGIIPNAKQTRIVNGTESSKFKWPWMAYINMTLIHDWFDHCGGSLIGIRHILTAAHCVVNLTEKEFKPVEPWLISVTLGVHNLLNEGERYHVAEIRPHPGYNRSYSVENDFYDSINDIAVLVLDRDVKLSKHVIPICLPDNHSNNSFELWSAVVVGWGDTSYLGNSSDVLREANVTIWRNDKCHEETKELTRIHENKICAGGRINQGRGVCNGDSGGPLMVYDNEKWMEIGIVESSNDCGELGHPSVFTRVTKYLDWIKEQMSKNI